MKKIYSISLFAIAFLSAICSAPAQIVSTVAGNPLGEGLNAIYSRKVAYSLMVDSTGVIYYSAAEFNRIRKISTSGILTTVAGTGTDETSAGYSGDGGPAINAEFNSPGGAAWDKKGNTYIADAGNSRIRKINAAGIITTIAGTGVPGYSGDGGTASTAQVNWPMTMTVDAIGNIYFFDGGSMVIRKIDTIGIITTIAGTGGYIPTGNGGPATAASLGQVTGIAVDASGNIYLAENYAHTIRKINTAGIINVFAGNGTSGFSGDGGAATSAQLYYPNGVVAAGDGSIYICDGWNRRVRKVSSTGIISTFAGTGSIERNGDGGLATAAAINYASALTLDVAGNVYIAQGMGDIRKINTSGIIETLYPYAGPSFSGEGPATSSMIVPDHTAVDRNGNVFISDIWNMRIYKVTPDGDLTVFAGDGTEASTGDGGPAAAAQLQSPAGIVIDSIGNIYFTENGASLRKIDTSGMVSTLSNDFMNPSSVVIDDSMNFYITEPSPSRILKMTPDGAVTTIAGQAWSVGFSGDGGPATSAELNNPRGVAVDHDGNVYIADMVNNRIRKVNTSGIITTIAGNGDTSPSGDGGLATSAGLPYPYGIALDNTGNIYVSTSYGVIRKIDASGYISTFGGLGNNGRGDGGPAIDARFGGGSLTFDALGNLYVTEDQYSVRKITMSPTGLVISGTRSVCVGSTTTLTSTVGGVWSSGSTSVATVGSSSGIVSGVAAGTAVISYSLSGSTVVAVVTVSAAPATGTFTGATSLCTGSSVTLSNTVSGGTWSCSNTSVATVGSATGIVSGVTAGNATITYTITSGCGTASTTAVVTVNATPSAAAITGTAAVCTGNTITLSNATSGGVWSSSNTSVAAVGSSSGVVNGLSAGNATITYTVSNGCGSATATKGVTVNAATSAGTITGAGAICTGGTLTLNDAVSGGTWSSNDGVVATVGSSSGVVTGLSTGNATITYTVSGSCGSASATAIVTVGTSASITGSLALCSGMTSSLSGGSTGGVWSSSNTAVATVGAANGILTAVSTGTSNITYATSSGCTATAVVTVSAPALIAGTSNACVGQTATLTDATVGGVWSSSNTSLATVDASTGVVTGIAAGTTTVSYVVSAGCYRTIAFTVKALPPAIAAPVTVCDGSTVYVAPPSTNGYSWTSSNTSVAVIGSSTGMLTGVAAGTTTLTYTTNTGCFVTTEATVNTAPAAITGTTALCSGTTSTLASTTPGGVWSSSNASVAAIGSATGAFTAGSAGTAVISYTAGGCRTTTVVTVSAISAITGTPSVCVGSSTALSNASAGGTWSSSNTSIATVGTSGILSGVAAGNATVTYTLSTGCIRTVTATVVATPAGITGSLSICPSTTATLSGGTAGGTWSGGNASIATINSSTGVLSGIGAGTINVSYTLTGCRVTAIATVNPLPAVITGTINACVAQTSTLNNATAGGAWTSNNTGIATVDPYTGVVTGVTAATTTITYTLGTGCYRATPFTVKALPPAIAASVAACVGTTTYVAPPSTNGKSWSSSNTTVATMGSSTGIITGVSTGTTILTYTATTGCYVTTEATVYALPSAGTITGPTSVVVGNTITLNDAAGGGVWSSGNVTRASIGSATGIVTGVAGGTATISYSVSNPGCTVRATQVISVLTSRPGGSGEFVVSNFQLYPNPTTGAFTVEVEEAGTFSVFSLDGKEVMRHNINTGVNQVTLSNELASGVYMGRFTSESGNTTMVRLVYER